MRLKLFVATLFFCCFGATSGLSQTQNVYDVYAIEYARGNGYAAVSKVALNTQSKDSVAFVYYIWYLRGHNDRRILVDVGFVGDTAMIRKSYAYYVRPDLALRRMGVEPNEITDVIITHPHYDHIGGLSLFQKANVWMQKNDYDAFVGAAWQKGGSHGGFDKQDVLMIVQANLDGRLTLVNGDSLEIIPGIRTFIGSKHTYESQHLLVDTQTDKVLLASDDCWFYHNLHELISVVLVQDPAAYIRQLRRMKTLVSDTTLIIPGHDPLVLAGFPSIAEGIVRIR